MLTDTVPELRVKPLHLAACSRRDARWDQRKRYAQRVAALYRGTDYDRYSVRMAACSPLLGFKPETSEAGEVTLKLSSAHFCRCRHCPVCQQRRQAMWQARFFSALPKIFEDYPTARYVYLTLTVRNCPVEELRKTLTWMNQAFIRLTKRKEWPALGWAKSVEVTRGKDGSGTAHPHFHVLLMVSPGYFSRNYLSQERWSELWKQCLRVDYTPMVHVRVVRPNKAAIKQFPAPPDPLPKANPGMLLAVLETFKYSVKAEDLLVQKDWLLEVTEQMHKTRAVALGGVFKDYLSEDEPEDLISVEQLGGSEQWEPIYFGWHERARRYLAVDNDNSG